MPHFPPNQFPHFTGPNFSVSNDRVLDHLRVQKPNTFKVPPATKNLIDPNVPVDPAADPIVLIGDNDPVTNETLRSGVAQAGALVYSTTPIIAGDPLVDGCFDGRNHLYFSDGDQWIPLANCLPRDNEDRYGDPQQGQQWFIASNVDTPCEQKFEVVQRSGQVDEFSSLFFTPGSDPSATPVPDYWIEYTGKEDITAKISVAASWELNPLQTQTDGGALCQMGVFKESSGGTEAAANNLQATGWMDVDAANPGGGLHSVSLNGYVSLSGKPENGTLFGDRLRIKVQNFYAGTGNAADMIVQAMNFNVQKA